jgi:hypothetical protein
LQRIEQGLNTLLARTEALAAPKPRSLSPAKHNILQVLEAMPPGDLDTRQKQVLIQKVSAEINAKYGGVGHSPSTIQPVLIDFLQSRRR